jgi:hypothetical protein
MQKGRVLLDHFKSSKCVSIRAKEQIDVRTKASKSTKSLLEVLGVIVGGVGRSPKYDQDSIFRCAADNCCSEWDSKRVTRIDYTYPTPAHATNIFEYLYRIIFARRHRADEVLEKRRAAQIVANYACMHQKRGGHVNK